MNWRGDAACRGANPDLFAPLDNHTDQDWEQLRGTAIGWCDTCPVLAACAADGDKFRHTGLWGGVYRRRHKGRYNATVLAENAVEPQLTDRRGGAHNGWGLAS